MAGRVVGVPVGHKGAAVVRAHFDAMEGGVPDAPRADELLLIVAVTDSGRPCPGVGGLEKNEIKGEDGLRWSHLRVTPVRCRKAAGGNRGRLFQTPERGWTYARPLTVDWRNSTVPLIMRFPECLNQFQDKNA